MKRTNVHCVIAGAAMAVLAGVTAQGAIATYSFENIDDTVVPGGPYITDVTPDYSDVAANAVASDITVGAGATQVRVGDFEGSNNAGSLAGGNTLRATFQTDAATGLAENGPYFIQFAVSPEAGYLLDLGELEFDAARGGTSTDRGFQVRYSFDGFLTSASFDAVALTAGSNVWNHYVFPLVDANQITGYTDSEVTFRIYGYTNGLGNVRIDNIVVGGSVLPVPEPASMALLAVGSLACLVRRRA